MTEIITRNIWVRMAADRLRRAGVEDARHEAGLILAHVLGVERARLAIEPDAAVGAEALAGAGALLARRERREPYAYLTGRREFYGLEFEVTPDVLIPRPETEQVVERALGWIGRKSGGAARVADIGTGSGAIAVAVAAHAPEARVVATDISEAALDVARRNAGRHGVEARVEFRQGPLFEAFEPGDCFDIICSNPPYVRELDREGMQAEVRDYEPGGALFAGADGLDLIRELVAGAAGWLRPGGALLMEFGWGQAGAIEALARECGDWATVTIHADLAEIPRVLEAVRR